MANSTLKDPKEQALKEQLDALNQQQRRAMEVERTLKLKTSISIPGDSQPPTEQPQAQPRAQEVAELNRMYNMPSPPEEKRGGPEGLEEEKEPADPDEDDQEDEPNEDGEEQDQGEQEGDQTDKPEEDDQNKLNSLRRLRDLEKASRAGEAAAGAGSAAGTAATAAEGAETAAATTGVIASTSWFWGPALAVLAILGLVIGLFMFVAVTAVAYCNSDSTVTQGIIWITGNSDFCKQLRIADSGTGGAGVSRGYEPPTPPGPGGNPNGVGCQDCVTVSSAGVPIKATNACAEGFGPCQIESVVAEKLAQLNSSLGGWQVTEAWPPTGYSPTDPNGIHQNSCHGNATCVDANFTNPGDATAQNISNFIAQANAAGLRAVYEVKTEAERNQLIAGGVPASNIQVVTAITATHFSVYNL